MVLLDEGRLCLIERNRAGQIYYLFPGGGVDEGETHEEAAVREAHEELGLEVELEGLMADLTFRGNRQTYFRARVTGGEFGTGTGPEMDISADSRLGSYKPVWLPLEEAVRLDTRPIELCEALLGGSLDDGSVLLIEYPDG